MRWHVVRKRQKYIFDRTSEHLTILLLHILNFDLEEGAYKGFTSNF